MKKLAACDWEDLLQVWYYSTVAIASVKLILNEQCAIPVFDALFPGVHHEILMDLLFELATWHALAKPQLHTESTVMALEHSTQCLGKVIRAFDKTLCAEYNAGKLPAEDVPHAKGRVVTQKTKPTEANTNSTDAGNPASSAKLMAKKKVHKLNLKTYKLHALGHYVEAIRCFGPSDGYSTQTVRLIGNSK